MVVGSDPWLGVCLFCESERQLKPSCTKQRWKVCKDHFMVTCPKCGHEGFWMENMKSGSYFACFSLDCNWRSTTPPNASDEPRPLGAVGLAECSTSPKTNA
jgi:hypothetical protein